MEAKREGGSTSPEEETDSSGKIGWVGASGGVCWTDSSGGMGWTCSRGDVCWTGSKGGVG